MKTKTYILFVLIALMSVRVAQAQQTNKLSIPDLTALAGKTISLPVCLDNSNEIVAVEFDLQIPDGSTLLADSKVLTNRATDHEAVFRAKGNNTYHCLIYSPTNSSFLGRTGELLTVNMQVSDSYAEDSQHNINLADVVLALRNGENVATETKAGILTMQKGPDLTVTDVVANAASYVPGSVATVSWQVKNVGAMSTGGGWTEYLSLKNGSGVSTLLSTTVFDGTLEAGGTVSRQVEISLPSILGIDGEALFEVEIKPQSATGESKGLLRNNVASSESAVTFGKALSMFLPASVEETSTRPVSCMLSRSGNRSVAETFTIVTSQDSRLSAPQTVTIPAGQSSVNFYLQLSDNDILDENDEVTITISGNNYTEIHSKITIVDNEYPDLTVESSKSVVSEGEAFQLTILASRAPKENLTISLSSEVTGRFNLPSTAILPAGETQLVVDVVAKDDDIPSLELSNAFTAYAPAYNKGQAIVILNDDDVPALELTLTPNIVSESDSPIAVAAKLRRTGVTNNKIIVKLSDDSDGGVYYGQKEIVLEKGVEEVNFNIGPKDNVNVDGDRTVNVTAAVYIASCSCSATGESAGVVSTPLTILDDDGPALSLVSAVSTLKEGGSTSLTISRNTDTSQPITVTLSSDHDQYLSYEHSVVIPADKKSVTIDVASSLSGQQGDSFTAVFTAQSDGFSAGTCYMMVTDQDLPDAKVTISVNKTEAEVGTEVELTVTVSNVGLAELSAGTVVKVHVAGETKLLVINKALAVGESQERTITTKMPTSIGTVSCYAVVNENNAFAELNHTNNTSGIISIKTQAPFSVALDINNDVYAPGDQVVIVGRLSGFNIANQQVEVYVWGDGFRKTQTVTTDAYGNFSTSWISQVGQFGLFHVGARYPSDPTEKNLASFNILGLNTSSKNVQLVAGEMANGRIGIYNPAGIDLTGATVETISVPDGCEFDYNISSTLKARTTTYLNYTIKKSSPSLNREREIIQLELTTAEGVHTTINVQYYAVNPMADLTLSTCQINTTVQKGNSRDYELTILNTGNGATGNITLSLPSWIECVTGNTVSSLNYGESATVVLRFNPTEDMQLNVAKTGYIGVNSENAKPKRIDYSITPVSSAEGVLTVEVADEYTYTTETAPHVEGANIIIRNPSTNELIIQGFSDSNGKFSATLQEGYYRLQVTADDHDSFEGNVLVSPEETTNKTINLSVQAIKSITSNWDVVETEVEDHYELVTTVEMETNVPVPVVQLNVPNKIDTDNLSVGESLVFYAVLTNKGLITAKDAALLLPEGFNHLSFEPLVEYTGLTIVPGQSVTIPVKVTRVSVPTRSPQRRANNYDNDPCVGQPGTLYYWDCGNDRKWHRYGIFMQIGSCNSNDPSTWNPTYNPDTDREWTGGWPVGTSISSSPTIPSIGGYGYISALEAFNQLQSEMEDKGCEPCQNGQMIAFFKCSKTFAEKGIDAVKDVLSLIHDFDNFDKNKKSEGENQQGDGDDNSGTDEKDLGLLGSLIDELNRAKTIDADVAEELKSALYDLKGVAGVMHLIGSGQNAFGKCFKLKDKVDWDNSYGCYSALSELIDDLFDEAATDLVAKYGHIPADKIKKFKAAGKNIIKVKKLLDVIMSCANDFVHACDHLNTGHGATGEWGDSGDENSQDQQSDGSSETPQGQQTSGKSSYIDNFTDNLSQVQQLMNSYKAIDEIFYGDEPDWDDVTFLEMEILNELDYVSSTNEELMKYKPEAMSTETFVTYIDNRRNYETNGLPTEIVEKLRRIVTTITTIEEHFRSMGYDNPVDYVAEEAPKVLQQLQESSNSVCSSVTLQFKQNMVMARQAFLGTLTIFNGHETEAMKDIKLSLVITGEDGNLVTEREFDVKTQNVEVFKYTGNPSLTQGWELDAQEKGVATVLFTPSKYAAPDTPKRYSFGGTLSFVDPFSGLTVTRVLNPVTLTVKPSPDLALTFFMQRDIYGDDPLTPDMVEPSIPAEFAVLVNNIGNGNASNVRMVTKQPQIVVNDKGLAVDFHLISSQLNNGKESPVIGSSAATVFGDIDAHSTAYAQWWFESSLLGHFVDYDINVKPLSYDNPDMSLINLEQTSIHELIRSVDVEHDNSLQKGFLTNDIQDSQDLPDMLYLSDGNVAPVAIIANTEVVGSNQTSYELTITPSSAGWNYGTITDPTQGYAKLKSIRRKSDGKEMSLRNFWQTDRTLVDGKDWLYDNNLHFVDEFGSSSETYILTFEPTPQTVLEVASVELVPAVEEVAVEPVDMAKVTFSKAIDPATFTADDITMNVQGVKQDASLIGITTDDNKTFTLDLSAINASCGNGYYTLGIQTNGINDFEGYQGANGKAPTGWVFFRGGLVQLLTSVWPAESGSVQRVLPSSEARVLRAPVAEKVLDQAQYGSTVVLQASAKEGFSFSKWTIDGQEASSTPEFSTQATGDLVIVANFQRKFYSVSIEKEGDGGSVAYMLTDPDDGQVSSVEMEGSGNYKYGTKFVLTATPDEGYLFDGWTVNGTLAESKQELALTVTNKSSITAKFSPEYILGDANGDKVVNIADVTAIINRINSTDNINFVEKAADVNGDGMISIADVTGVINIIHQ